ncbi:MAG TPA: MFS transporter [Flavisolibacter sp.]|nr:MFS transporter [Flavisolibacter sp.]
MTEAATLNLSIPVERKAGAVQAWTLIFAMFLPIMAIVALAATLPTLFGRFHDLPNAGVLVPMLLTAPALCIALISPFAGRLSDLFGRRNLLLSAMFLYSFGGVAPFFLDNFWAVMGSRILLGVAEAFILTIGNALLADYFDEHDRHKWLAVQGAVGPLLAFLTILGSGFLAAKGWQWPFIVYALAFPIFIAGFVYLWEPAKKSKSQNVETDMTSFPWRTVLLITGITLVTSVIYYVFIIHFSLVLTANGIKDEGRIGVLSSIASIAVPFGAYVYKKFSARPVFFLLLLIYLLMGVGYIGISLMHDEKWIVATAWIQQVAVGLTVPTLVAWALHSLPVQHRGLGMGFWSSSFFLGQFVNPLVVGFINGFTGGIVTTVIVVGILCIAIALVVWLPILYKLNVKAA